MFTALSDTVSADRLGRYEEFVRNEMPHAIKIKKVERIYRKYSQAISYGPPTSTSCSYSYSEEDDVIFYSDYTNEVALDTNARLQMFIEYLATCVRLKRGFYCKRVRYVFEVVHYLHYHNDPPNERSRSSSFPTKVLLPIPYALTYDLFESFEKATKIALGLFGEDKTYDKYIPNSLSKEEFRKRLHETYNSFILDNDPDSCMFNEVKEALDGNKKKPEHIPDKFWRMCLDIRQQFEPNRMKRKRNEDADEGKFGGLRNWNSDSCFGVTMTEQQFAKRHRGFKAEVDAKHQFHWTRFQVCHQIRINQKKGRFYRKRPRVFLYQAEFDLMNAREIIRQCEAAGEVDWNPIIKRFDLVNSTFPRGIYLVVVRDPTLFRSGANVHICDLSVKQVPGLCWYNTNLIRMRQVKETRSTTN